MTLTIRESVVILLVSVPKLVDQLLDLLGNRLDVERLLSVASGPGERHYFPSRLFGLGGQGKPFSQALGLTQEPHSGQNISSSPPPAPGPGTRRSRTPR